jgi:hypothetical protein
VRSPPHRPRWERWHTLVRAVAAVRSLEPERVQVEVRRLGTRRRWLKPLAYAAGTVAIVFQGVLLLLRDWRLLLLQLVPATWLWLMTWNLRTHLFSKSDLPTAYRPLLAVSVILVSLLAYWCNAVFAFTVTQTGPRADVRMAFRQARERWRFITGIALATGVLQAGVWAGLSRVSVRAFVIGLTVMLVVQIYMFIAVPLWLLGGKPKESRREAITRSATTGVLSGVASAPGFLFNRIGLLLLGIGSVWWLGVILVSLSAVLHVTASSSVRVVKLTVRLGVARPTAEGEPSA